MQEERVFISYSHQDQKQVERIIQMIREHIAQEVWYDDRLVGGQLYFSVLAEQIMKCGVFVFMVSERSVKSDFCLRELELAASERKKIIAIWLENTPIPPRVKLTIQNTHYVNYYSSTEERFTAAIERAFSANAHDEGRMELRDTAEDRGWNGKKYFLSDQTILRIEELLEGERKGRYSRCFEPENAVLLGLAYEMGVCVEADAKQAAFYYHISAHLGSVDGAYLEGALKLGDTEDVEAVHQLRTAYAEKGCAYALVKLGDDFYDGKNGCDKDLNKAYDLFQRAAELGDPQAMYYMSYGYRRGEVVEQDFPICLMYALSAIERGFPRAFRTLAFMYRDGDYYPQDHQKSLSYFEEAIKRGDYLSLCHMGWIYGALGNTEKQRDVYEQAVQYADKGLIRTGLPYYRMAYLYQEGLGVAQDYLTASRLYLKGAERKHESSLIWAVPCINKVSDDGQRKELLLKASELGCNMYMLSNWIMV